MLTTATAVYVHPPPLSISSSPSGFFYGVVGKGGEGYGCQHFQHISNWPSDPRRKKSNTIPREALDCGLHKLTTVAMGSAVGSGTKNHMEKWRGSSSQERGAVPEERGHEWETKTTDVSPPTPTLGT